MAEKEAYKISFGGWYQRTTLHLTEVYEFLSKGTSRLTSLSQSELTKFHNKLDIKSVSRETGYLDYVKVITNLGMEIRYYEEERNTN